MDIKKTAREIGLFETAINLSRVSESADVAYKAGAAMPLPDTDIKERVEQAAKWLLSYGKRKYLFITPEIALVEAMAKLAPDGVEAIIIIPCDLEPEAKERLKNNLPRGMVVSLQEEPYFLDDFLPRNGMLVICGYASGERAMTLMDTYRLVEHYSRFPGRKAFIPYVELERAARYDGWIEINHQRFNEEWRRVV